MFDKQWFIKFQKPLLLLANTHYGKGILGHGLDHVDFILPNAVFQKIGERTYKAEFRTHDKYAKRLFYEFKPVWKAFHWFDENIANVYVPRLNLGFDTLTVFPAAGNNSPIDGSVGRNGVNQTFSNIRSGAGTTVSTTASNPQFPDITTSNTTNQFQQIVRCIYGFDTSSLGAHATVDTGTFSIFGSDKANQLGGSPGISLVASTPASWSTLANSDYANLGTTQMASDISYNSFSTSGYNNFTLNPAGLANINKTGISGFGTRISWDRTGTFSGSWSSASNTRFNHYHADQSGTSNDPKLVVTYTLPPGNFLVFM